MPDRRKLPALLRAKVRVPDPIANGIRVNGPTDGWVSDPASINQFGDYSNGSQVPLTTLWLGADMGTFAGGPVAWKTLPWQSRGAGLLPAPPPITSKSYVLPSVERALAVLRNPILTTPWHVTKSSGEELPLPLWLRDPMLTGGVTGPGGPVHPAARRLVGSRFWMTFLDHAILFGRGAFAFIENSQYEPVAGSFRLLNPFLVGQEDGRWVIDPYSDEPLETDFNGRFTMNGQTWRIVVMGGLTPSEGPFPEGILFKHFETLRLGAAVSQYVLSQFGSGIPSGYLKVSTPNATQATIDQIKSAWMEAHGTGKQSVAVLNSTVDYNPVSVKPVDAQAADQVHLSDKQVAHAFGLDAVWVGEGASGMVYNNTSDRRKDLIDITVRPWGQAFTETLSTLLPYGTTLQHQWPRFAAADITQLIPAMKSALESGLMTLAEARQVLGLLPTDSQFTPTTPEGQP